VPLNLLLISAIQTLPAVPWTANKAARDRRWRLRSLTVTSCPSSHRDHENIAPARRFAMDAHSEYRGRHGKDNPNIDRIFEDTRGLFADLAYDDFSYDPSLDETNRVSVLPDPQSTPGSLDDNVEFWSSVDPDLSMYRASATPKTSFETPGLPSPASSPARVTSFFSTDVQHGPRPIPSDKKQWFADWNLHKLATYDLKIHLPAFVTSESIRIEISGVENDILYDKKTAIFEYLDLGKYIQGVIFVHVRHRDFELDDLFLVFNDYPPTLPAPMHDLEWGPYRRKFPLHGRRSKRQEEKDQDDRRERRR